MKKNVLYVVLAVYAVIVLALMIDRAWAASACTQEHFHYKGFDVIEMSWTAHTDGTFTPVTTNWDIDGIILAVDTNPGSTAPTDDYDSTLTDGYGIDVMGGALANRDEANSERTMGITNGTYGAVVAPGPLTLNITNNIVNGATGKVRIIYIGK